MQGPRSPARGAHAHHRSSSSNASPDHGTAGVASPTRNAVVTALLRQVSDAARQRAITEREKAAIKDILLAGELTEARDRLTLATSPPATPRETADPSGEGDRAAPTAAALLAAGGAALGRERKRGCGIVLEVSRHGFFVAWPPLDL